MEHKLATAEKRVLVDLVKLVQKRGLEGENGGWKEFLNVYDKKIGSSLSDPTRRSSDVLVAFLSTFKKKEDIQLIARVLQCDANRNMIEKFKEESPDKETPEQRLVRLTLEHPTYPLDYAFESQAEDWFITEFGKKKSKVMKSTRMLAIDCEMVGCEDGTDALVRVAAVDRDLKVVLDKLVKPDKPVADYRTAITGITAEDLEKATLSVADIQKKLRRFLSPGTILVGHGLHNDLQVLKIDHARVIDSANVFRFIGGSYSKKPSLNYVCKHVLGHDVRMQGAAHNCVHDAAAAMKVVLAVIEKGVDTMIPLSEEMMEAEKTKSEIEKTKLLCHKIANNVPSEEIKGVISGDFTIEVKPPKHGGGYYSAVLVFNSREEANQAFDNVDANLDKDRAGLPQKMLEFKLSSGSGTSLYVRKMVQDDQISTNKRTNTEENNDDNVSSTRRKVENDSKEMKEANAKLIKENEELKRTLLLHKIANNVPSEEIQRVISGDFTIEVKPSKRAGGYYSAVLVFNSPEEANQAFDNVDANLDKDRAGLPQKMLVFKLSSGSGTSLYVRKMIQDDEISTRKRSNTEENNDDDVSAKRRKLEDDSEKMKEANAKLMKENEELKRKLDSVQTNEDQLKAIKELETKLKTKEHEIKAQDTIIKNLKKQLEKKRSKASG